MSCATYIIYLSELACHSERKNWTLLRRKRMSGTVWYKVNRNNRAPFQALNFVPQGVVHHLSDVTTFQSFVEIIQEMLEMLEKNTVNVRHYKGSPTRRSLD